MQAARMVGSLAVGIANNAGTPLLASADLGIFLDTGPEVISGSTRLKAGTAQKIVLNTLSSALMVRLHKVYGNLMVDMHPTNAKLTERAVSLTMRVTGADAAAARNALDACQYQIKTAIIMLLKKQSATDAQSLLDHHTGNLRAALQ
jgi:N-acetylmuramic acid 6-phosphate etherase